MAARKKSAKAGAKCKMIPTKSGGKTKRCWNSKGKFVKSSKR